jgi:hypothetical protein
MAILTILRDFKSKTLEIYIGIQDKWIDTRYFIGSALFQVEYHITHDGSNGISRAEARLTMGSIQADDLPLTQTYGSSFSSVKFQ